MSQWTVVAVRCDRRTGPAVDGQCTEQEAARPGERLPALLERLAADGWSRTGGRNDYCAEHSRARLTVAQ